jgi:hypothetical protein
MRPTCLEIGFDLLLTLLRRELEKTSANILRLPEKCCRNARFFTVYFVLYSHKN